MSQSPNRPDTRPLPTALRFSQALVRALVDSTQTAELLVGEEISSAARMEALLPLMRAFPSGRAILADRPRIDRKTVDLDALSRLPPGTLGHAFAAHLRREGLDLDALSTPVTRCPSEDANYLLMRIRQTHDLWHTLLGLGASGHHEVLVHAFQWPQLRMPYSALVVAFGTLKHILGERRLHLLRYALGDAMRAGRAALPLITVRWEDHFDTPVRTLRARYHITPAPLWRGVSDAVWT